MAEKTATWNPVVDCIGPLIEALNPLKFCPVLHPFPDLAEIYQELDVEMCYLWLQNFMNPAMATDFKDRLDSCLHHWVALINSSWELRWVHWDLQQWQNWFNESDGNLWKETWDEVTDEFQQTVEYLQKLGTLIEAKVADHKAEKQTQQGRVLETQQSTEAGGRAGNIKPGFHFREGQVLYNGHPLQIPGNEAIEILKVLVDNFGQVVPHKQLDAESTQTDASDRLRHHVRILRAVLEKHKVPCQIETKRQTGYALTTSRSPR